MRYQTYFEHDGENLSFKVQYKIIQKENSYILYIKDIKERSKEFKTLQDCESHLRTLFNNLHDLAKYEKSLK